MKIQPILRYPIIPCWWNSGFNFSFKCKQII